MANYGANRYIDFSKLWNVLEKKEYNKQWLKNNGIHSNTVAKLTKNENVTANAKSVLSVLGACIKDRDEIEIICEGEDEEEALQEMIRVVENELI